MLISLYFQVALLSGNSSQVVLSADGLVEDLEGRVLFDPESIDKSTNKNQIVSSLGLDISSIDLSTLEDGEEIIIPEPASEETDTSKASCIAFNFVPSVSFPSPVKQSNNHTQLIRRGPGRPKRDDVEVEPPIGKVWMRNFIISEHNVREKDFAW